MIRDIIYNSITLLFSHTHTFVLKILMMEGLRSDSFKFIFRLETKEMCYLKRKCTSSFSQQFNDNNNQFSIFGAKEVQFFDCSTISNQKWQTEKKKRKSNNNNVVVCNVCDTIKLLSYLFLSSTTMLNIRQPYVLHIQRCRKKTVNLLLRRS